MEVLLAQPRGFCAGVDRAIEIVERALAIHGAPVYVRHEIVHNRYVVEELRAKGAVFVDELDEVPAGGIVIFSAHGVPKSVPAEAAQRKMLYLHPTQFISPKATPESDKDKGPITTAAQQLRLFITVNRRGFALIQTPDDLSKNLQLQGFGLFFTNGMQFTDPFEHLFHHRRFGRIDKALLTVPGG